MRLWKKTRLKLQGKLDEIKEMEKKYYLENREKILEKRKAFYQANKERLKEKARLHIAEKRAKAKQNIPQSV